MKKKIISIATGLALLTLAGCGNTNTEKSNKASQSTSQKNTASKKTSSHAISNTKQTASSSSSDVSTTKTSTKYHVGSNEQDKLFILAYLKEWQSTLSYAQDIAVNGGTDFELTPDHTQIDQSTGPSAAQLKNYNGSSITIVSEGSTDSAASSSETTYTKDELETEFLKSNADVNTLNTIYAQLIQHGQANAAPSSATNSTESTN